MMTRVGAAITPEQLHILQHSLGCDQYGQSEHRGPDESDGCFGYHRNLYVSNPTPALNGLCELGYLKRFGPYRLFGGSFCYTVTPEGLAVMLAESPRPPRVSRGRRRYLQWLKVSDAFGGMSFGEWLRRKFYKPR